MKGFLYVSWNMDCGIPLRDVYGGKMGSGHPVFKYLGATIVISAEYRNKKCFRHDVACDGLAAEVNPLPEVLRTVCSPLDQFPVFRLTQMGLAVKHIAIRYSNEPGAYRRE